MKHMIIGGILASTMMVSAAQSEETISAVHAFPQTLIYTQSFLKFVDKVNTAGAGVVKIEVRGGPEAIGMFQQPDAVRDGIVDMVYTPGSFYGGALPEKDALVASNLTAVEARANGHQHIAVLHGHVGLVGAVHAEHADELAIRPRKGAQPHQRVRDGIVEHPCKVTQL